MGYEVDHENRKDVKATRARVAKAHRVQRTFTSLGFNKARLPMTSGLQSQLIIIIISEIVS